MKVVVLSGSPHKAGSTARLVDRFIAGATEAGHEVARFDTAFLNVHPCMACDRCQKSGKCVFEDDMVTIGKALAEAECICFATPIYYYGICSQLKVVIDRYYGIEGSIRNNQKTVFITAMADDREDSIEAANASYKAIINWMNWTDCGIVNAIACAVPEDLDGKDYEEKAYQLGKSI